MEFRVEPVEASATWALRQAVLRPHETVEQVARSDADDDGDRSATFAALAPDGEVVGSVRVAPGRPPSTVGGHGAVAGGPWRLRGMATRDDARNLGIGTAVLARVLRHVQEQGGGLVWCNARVAAVGLYGRAGLVVHGEAWDDPDVGPHIVMWRVIESAPSASAPSASAPSDQAPSDTVPS